MAEGTLCRPADALVPKVEYYLFTEVIGKLLTNFDAISV